VLCDPWLTDGIYYGSWYHYPPLRFTPESFSDVDYIYISHIHPDHLDSVTLQRLPKSIPVLIHDYEDKFVLRIIKQLGFESVIELPHEQSFPLGPDFSIEIMAADDCDPAICGLQFGCAAMKTSHRTLQIDSLALFQGGGKTLLNVNDCPFALASQVCRRIAQRLGGIDFLLTGYGGAGPYPQCFENLDENEKITRAQAKQAQFLGQAVDCIQCLRPKFFMPFAGQYVLAGSLAHLNPLRGVAELEELAGLFQPQLERRGLRSELVQLNSGDWFDLETETSSAPFVPPDAKERSRYIREVLSLKHLTYQNGGAKTSRRDMTPLLGEAHARMLRKQDQFGYRSPWRIYIDTGEERLYAVSLNGEPVATVAQGEELEPFVRIRLDHVLFEMILSRKAHWNNAEIGSHLRYFRQPDVFERNVYHFLCYLHC